MMHRNALRPRRGLAMLLVLIALGMATILTTSYLASRDNSTVVSANVSSAAEARWAALGGIDLAVAVLETETDWRTDHVNGKLLDDFVIGVSTVDVDVLDVVTGQPPTVKSNEIDVTVTAVTGGIKQVATARAVVAPPAETLGIDVDLSEFVIFVRDGVQARDAATVTRWLASPLGRDGKRLSIGVQGAGAGTISIIDAAAMLDTTVFHGPAASTSLVSNNGPAVQAVALGDMVPMPASPAAPPEPGGGAGDVVLGGADTWNVSADSEVTNLTVTGGASVGISDGVTLVCTEALDLDGGKLTVEGSARLVVKGALTMRSSSIQLGSDARLVIYLGGGLDVEDAYIGDRYLDAMPYDNAGTASWMNPERMMLYGTSSTPASWQIRGRSLVKGSIYAPEVSLDIREDAVLYGRLATAALLIRENAAIFYDHTLDDGNGYTTLDGLIYDDFDRIKAELLGLSTLGDADSEKLADDLDVLVVKEYDSFGIASTDDGGIVQPGPTPRTVPVDFALTSYGVDVTAWEQKAADYVPAEEDTSDQGTIK